MKTTLTLRGYMGRPWEVTGDLEAGLLVHRMGKRYVITHIGTGAGIGASDTRLTDALARRRRLLNLLPDWTPDTLESLAAASGRDLRAFTDVVRAAAY